jgi:hypothetical protein
LCKPVCKPKYRHTTAYPMTARRMVENCVLTNQTAVVDEMLNKHLLPEEYIYPFVVISGMVADRRLAGRMSETRERNYY